MVVQVRVCFLEPVIHCRVNRCKCNLFITLFRFFFTVCLLQLSLLPDVTMVLQIPPPFVPLASALPISTQLSPERQSPPTSDFIS